MGSEMTFREGVRLRPAMYLGGKNLKGFINLISYLIHESISIYNKERLFFTFTIQSDDNYIFSINTPVDPMPIISRLTQQEKAGAYFYFQCLPCVTSKIEILAANISLYSQDGSDELIEETVPNEHEGVAITFTLDRQVFTDLIVDYYPISEALMMIAILNENIEILLKDCRQEHVNQNYFHFPDGMQYLFRQYTSGEKNEEVFVNETIGDNSYRISLGFVFNPYCYTARIFAFANDESCSKGGSLTDGIIDGALEACKQYIKSYQLLDFKPSRKRVQKYIIAVGAIRGIDLCFAGSVKEYLDEPRIRKEIKTIVQKSVFTYLCKNITVANEMLDKFIVYTPEVVANIKPNSPEHFKYIMRASGMKY